MRKSASAEPFLRMILLILLLSACATPPSAPPSSSLAIKSLDARVRFVADVPSPGIAGLAAGPENRLVALKEDGAMEVVGREGVKGTVLLPGSGKGANPLKKPGGAVFGNGRFYVTDTGNHRVALFDDKGSWIGSFGVRGSSPKAFSTPQGIAFSEGRVFVADPGNRRIQVFGPNGEFIGAIGPSLRIMDEKAKKALLEKPSPRDPVKEELEKIKLILQKKPAGDEGPKTVPLVNPIDVAVDPRGLIYIVDTGDDAVKVCDAEGVFIDRLPNVKSPGAVSASADGIYLADRETLVIRKYGFQMQLLYAFGIQGAGPGQFASIDDLAVDASGALWVADGKRGLIHGFQPEPEPRYHFWAKSPPPAFARWARDLPVKAVQLAWDGEKTLYAVGGSEIYRIQEGRAERLAVGEKMDPVAVAGDSGGFLWVLDGAGKQAVKIDGTGAVLAKAFQLTDSSLRKASRVRDIAVGKKGVVSVADYGNRWVWLQAFKPDGSVLSTVIRNDKAGRALEGPAAISLDDADNLYVLDDKTLQVHVYNASGEPTGSFSVRGRAEAPVDMCVMHGEVYVTDSGGDRIQVFGIQGAFLREIGIPGSGKGDFTDPAGIAVTENLTVYVADTGNSRIQVLEQVLTPATPLEVKAVPGIRKVDLTWNKNPETYPLAYQVFRTGSMDEPFAFIGSTRQNRFMDQEVVGGKRYFYRVSALAERGNESLPTQPVGAEPAVYTPDAPKDFKGVGMEWSVDLSWGSDDRRLVAEYIVYRQAGNQKFEIGRTRETSFKDQSLSPDTAYTYLVAAVSTDGQEGSPGAVTVKTKVATKDPIEIMVIEMQDIFSNAYKIYEEEGVGRIRVLNNSGDRISNLKISFMIKEFMDFPSQYDIRDLEPGKSHDLLLKAVFNNKILEVTEDTPTQTEIRASYFYNDLPREFTRNYAANIYEKHRMMWNIPERFAVFVTPKDPVIIDFVRASVTPYGKTESAIQRAAIVFNAMGASGITYLPDPNNPYQISSGKIDFVDYLQFPRETLKRKAGDCDDLVALFSASLESMGISTHAVEIPGHMLMMFSTDIESGNSADTMNGLFAIHQGRLWVPVETTLVGSSFMKAWEKGSASYYQWHKNGLKSIDMRTSWRQFKPASLPDIGWRAPELSRQVMEGRFKEELASLKTMELKLKSKKYYDILATKPNDTYALMQIGIIYGREGSTRDAIRAFDKILEKDPGNAAALNNKANALFLESRYEEAARMYDRSGALEPKDPLIWVNQARCFQEMKDLAQAKKAFRKAFELDRSVAVRYRMMAIELLSGF